MGQFNLDNPPPGHSYTFGVVRNETDGERRVRLFKDMMLFVLAVVFVALVIWCCFDTLRDAAALQEEKKWAMSVISAATGGVVGYLLKK